MYPTIPKSSCVGHRVFLQSTGQIVSDPHSGIPCRKVCMRALSFSCPQTAGRNPELPYDPAVHECDSNDNWWSKWSSDKDTDVTYH